jgi:transposase
VVRDQETQAGQTDQSRASPPHLEKRGLRLRRIKRQVYTDDPRRAALLARICYVIRHLPRGSVVLFLDEKGPITVKRYGGYRWTAEKRLILPKYQKTRGQFCLFAVYELLRGRVRWKFDEHATSVEFIAFLRQIRRWYPHQSILIVLDSDTIHPQKSGDSRREMRRLQIHWLSLPKGDPDDSPMETVLIVLQGEAIAGRDAPHTAEQKRRISHSLQRRNRCRDRSIRIPCLLDIHTG